MVYTVLLVDDHPVFRSGLRYLLEDEEDMQIVGEAGDGQSALENIAELLPDIVVMDVSMPRLNGIEAMKRIAAEFPKTIVVALSIHAESQFVEQMLQAGAAGYILKESVPEELVKGIRCVMLGDGYLSPAITGIVVSQMRQTAQIGRTHANKKNDILETKFHQPKLPGNYIPRPNLVDLLEKNRELPLQIITAPAGYGKSTLVSSWIKEHNWPNTWLSLDTSESDLFHFVACFIHAIRKMYPDAMPRTKTLLKVGTLPPIQALAITIINELNQIEGHFLLVLDDFHFIAEKSVHDLLTELFRHPSPFMHLIIIGRMDPFLPIAALRAQGLLAELRMKNLQFTNEETAKFLECTLEHEVNKSISLTLNKKLEGWIAGMQLAIHSINSQQDMEYWLQESNNSFQFLKEYLFDEVLQRQPN